MSKSKKQRFSVPKVKGLEGGAVNVPKFTKYKKNQAGSFQFGPNPEKSAQMFNAANSGDATGAGTSAGGGCSEGFYGEEPTEMELNHALYNYFAVHNNYKSVEDYVNDNYRSKPADYKRELCSYIQDKVEEEAGECEECESLDEDVIGDIKDTISGKAQKFVDRAFVIDTIKKALKATKDSKHPVMFLVAESCPLNDKDFQAAVKLWGGLNVEIFTCQDTFTWSSTELFRMFPWLQITQKELQDWEYNQKNNIIYVPVKLEEELLKQQNPAMYLPKLYLICKQLKYDKQITEIDKLFRQENTLQNPAARSALYQSKGEIKKIDQKLKTIETHEEGSYATEHTMQSLSNKVKYAIKYKKRLVFKFTKKDWESTADDFKGQFTPQGNQKFVFDLEGLDIKTSSFDPELNYKQSTLSNHKGIKTSNDRIIAGEERAALGRPALGDKEHPLESFLGENMFNIDSLFDPIDFIDKALQWAYDEKLCTKDIDDDGQISIICDGGPEIISSVGSTLDDVCAEHGYTCEKDGPIFVIITPERLTEEMPLNGPVGKDVAKQIKDLADVNKLTPSTAKNIITTATIAQKPTLQKKMDDLVKQVTQ